MRKTTHQIGRQIRHQKRIPGVKREPMGATVLHEIREAVTRDALRYGVSRSFVIAVMLAEIYGIRKQEPLNEHSRAKGVRHLRAV